MIVVDASAVVEFLLGTPAGLEVERTLFDGAPTLCVPHLLDLEVAQVVRRFAAAGKLSAARGRAALGDLADLPLQRYPHEFLLPRIWELRGSLSAYDAVYLALAEALDASLLTLDRQLAIAAGRRTLPV